MTQVKCIGFLLACSAACLAAGAGDYPALRCDLYVDATVDNVWPTDGGSYPLLSDWSYGSGESTLAIANEWYRKEGSTEAIDGTAFQGFGVSLPQLTMTVNNVDSSKTYDVYAVCWVKKNTGGEYWYTLAAMGGNTPGVCDYDTADAVFSEGQHAIIGVQLYLGQVSGVSSFTVDVDGPKTSEMSRAWFDGIALVEVTVDSIEPVPGRYDYTHGQMVQLNAYDYVDCPAVYKFERWIGDVSDPYAPQTTILMDSLKTVTAVFNYPEPAECGDGCHPILAGDVNKDCVVDMEDLAILARDWLID